MVSAVRLALVATAVSLFALSVPPGASADLSRPWFEQSDGATGGSGTVAGRSVFSREDPPSEASGLPAAAENMELVSELNPQFFGGVRIGEIADLTVHKGYAYLNSWDAEECDRGGVYVVDIRDVAQPKEIAYIPPVQPFYHGEGAHAISVDTPAFQGDILAVNNETWGSNITNECGPADQTGGGFDLYDVSDPANPKPLVQGAGDPTIGGEVDENPLGNSYHSVFLWQAGPRAYLVASDNVEFPDVDIWDVTDPTAPVQVGDHDLFELFPQIVEGDETNLGGNIFNHDMVVKQIGGRYIMSVSNWDSGYVQIDVTDPANPTYVTDTTFGTDALRPALGSSEGNAHQSEFSGDDQFLLAADEDFSPYRSEVEVLTGPGAGDVVGVAAADAAPVLSLPDGEVNGPTQYVGTACDGFEIPAPPAVEETEDAVAVVQRGPDPSDPESCPGGFAEKLANVAEAGYDASVVFNQPDRPDGDPLVQMTTLGAPIPAVFVTRETAVGTDEVDGRLFPGLAGATPEIGAAGEDFRIADIFDGWGYTHLYDAKTSERIDSYAVPESQDPRFASGFGDLSVHEFATDPTEPIAYSAYYGAGMRVFRFSRADGLVPTGKWIDDDGNGSNFWGVETFTSDGERYIAGSDRDFGLQIFRYTGPGAAARPACTDVSASTPAGVAVQVPLNCTDANGNTLTRSIAAAPASGTVSAVADGAVTYTPNAGFTGTDTFRFVASDGPATSAPATATVTVAPAGTTPPDGPVSNSLGVRIGRYARNRLPLFVTVQGDGRLVSRLLVRLRRKGGEARYVRAVGGTTQITDGAGTYTVRLNVTGRKAKRIARARKRGNVNARVKLAWTPTGGTTNRLERKTAIRRTGPR